jgi:hypothetical protein
MKKIFTMVIALVLFGLNTPGNLKAQLAYSPFLDSLIQLADHQSILLLTRQLAGDTTVVINGQTPTISSRHYNNPNNSKAAVSSTISLLNTVIHLKSIPSAMAGARTSSQPKPEPDIPGRNLSFAGTTTICHRDLLHPAPMTTPPVR